MINLFIEMLSYPFLARAIVVGILVSICAALLGTILVPKRFTMIGNALSSVGYGSMAIAKALSLNAILFSMPILIIASFFILKLNDNSRIKGDQALGIISVSSLAIGTMTISHSTGFNIDVCNYMFGTILAMESTDVRISIVLSIFIITLFIIYHQEIFTMAYDEDFASVLGLNVERFNLIAAAITSVVIILGMKMMGALLISSLIIFPAISASRICSSYKSVSLLSVLISVLAFIIGISLSYMYAFPTGASIVVVNLIIFIILSLLSRIEGKNK